MRLHVLMRVLPLLRRTGRTRNSNGREAVQLLSTRFPRAKYHCGDQAIESQCNDFGVLRFVCDCVAV
jgi:hypothetical protein